MKNGVFNDRSRFDRFRPQFVHALNLMRQIKYEFVEDKCTREANAMAYRTLFSSVPILAVFLSIFTMFEGFGLFQDKIIDKMYTFLVPNAGEVVRDYMLRFAENTKTLGTVGFIGTIIVALYLFWAIERSFNTMWDIGIKRGVVRKFTAFTALLVWTPIFVGLSFYLTGKLEFYVPDIINKVDFTFHHWLTLRFAPVFFSFLGLTTMYILLPNTRVNLRAAAYGGMVAAVGWEVVKVGFNMYVLRAVGYSKVYGSLAVIPIFIVGLFLLWLVVFLGLEITYVFHNYRHHRTWDEEEWRGIKPYVAVAAMLELGRRFRNGEKIVGVSDLSELLHVAIPTLREVFDSMETYGLVFRLDEDTYLPAKSLTLIGLDEVVSAGVGELGAVEKMGKNFGAVKLGLEENLAVKLQNIFDDVAAQYRSSLANITMADLLSEKETSGGNANAAVSV